MVEGASVLVQDKGIRVGSCPGELKQVGQENFEGEDGINHTHKLGVVVEDGSRQSEDIPCSEREGEGGRGRKRNKRILIIECSNKKLINSSN